MIGQTLGHYRVLEHLGAGGMGVVYRARDEQLGRDVALKVLPDAFVGDAERMARFGREARLLASLNHPNIAAIYGLQESSGIRAISMELVEGPSLAELLHKGPIPLEEALPIARQIADALEAAHERGIIHRDLKPANVKLTPEGKAKVLDFGLAKAVGENPAAVDPSASPTISEILSRTGVILGTAAYMSPEQARGKPLDKRTDIWSFGCLLYELLSGKMVFYGGTVSDTIAQILQREPDWKALPQNTPVAVRRLLRRCLQKDPQKRLRDIADARVEIEEALTAPASDSIEALSAVAARPAPWWRRGQLWMSVAALSVVLAAFSFWFSPRRASVPTQQIIRYEIPAPLLSVVVECTIDISHDGSRLVYVGEQEGKRQVYLRRMDSLEAAAISGTENAFCPFFSPDGQWVAFWADQQLKKISLMGGAPVSLYEAPMDLFSLPLKASWGADGWILFASLQAGGRGILERISANGGKPERLVAADIQTGEYYLFQPELLPGGENILFTAAKPGTASAGDTDVVVQSLKTGQRHSLVKRAFAAHYVPTGHLVYVQKDTLMAAPFDLKHMELDGTPVAMMEGLSVNGAPSGADFTISDNGSLVYLPQVVVNPEETFVWVDRQGKEQPVANVRRMYKGAQLSPDGKKLATWLGDDRQVWVLDIERGLLTRVTTEHQNYWNIWSPDGRRLVFNSVRSDSPGTSLFWQPADGTGVAERLTTTDLLQQPRSFSPDGKLLIYQEQHPETGWDIWVLPMEEGAKPRPVLKSPFNEYQPKLSPDGRWLAYVSNESGRDEIYVRPFPAIDQKWQISTEGGVEPAWARSGSELFYRNISNPLMPKLMAVSISATQELRAGRPTFLFQGSYDMVPVFGQSYDVSPDGKRFVMLKYEPPKPPKEINVVVNWFAELRRRVPVGTK